MAAKKKDTRSFAQKAANVVTSNIGLDDLGNMAKHVKKGEWGSAAKSLGAAALEVGTTIVPIGKVGVAAKAAEGAAAKTIGKTAAKEVAASTASRRWRAPPQKARG